MGAHPLTPLPNLIRLYRDIHQLTETGQVTEAFDRTCRTLNLGIDPLSHRAFELVLGKLCEVGRFEGNVHIAKNRKGTTGQHTLMVMPLIAAVGTMALGKPGATRGFNSKAWQTSAEAAQGMVHDMCIQVLMHDLGEEIAELSSLSQRRLAGKMAELPKVERKIAEFTMRLAYYAVLATPDQDKQKYLFDREIDAIRRKVEPGTRHTEEIVGQTLGQKIDTCMNEVTARLHLDILPPRAIERLRNYMAAYDEPEGFSHFSRFNGVVVKHCQNMQTVLHMVEHLNKDGAVPYHFAQSSEAHAALWYADRGLPKVYAAANPANPLQMQVARASAQMAYAINLAILDAPVPCILDRSTMKKLEFEPANTESDPRDTAARQSEIRAAAKRHMALSTGLTDFSTPDISAGQLMVAYTAAYHLAQHDPSYRPPASKDDSLAGARELTPALIAHMQANQQAGAVPRIIAALAGAEPRPLRQQALLRAE